MNSESLYAKFCDVLFHRMEKEGIALSEAIIQEMKDNNVDTESVFSTVDFIEENTDNMNQCEFLMMVACGQTTDYELKAPGELG